MVTYVYAFLNMCLFLGISKSLALTALKVYVFQENSEKPAKIDETTFFDSLSSETQTFFQMANLINVSTEPSALSIKLKKSKSLTGLLRRSYQQYFDDLIKIKNSYK